MGTKSLHASPLRVTAASDQQPLPLMATIGKSTSPPQMKHTRNLHLVSMVGVSGNLKKIPASTQYRAKAPQHPPKKHNSLSTQRLSETLPAGVCLAVMSKRPGKGKCHKAVLDVAPGRWQRLAAEGIGQAKTHNPAFHVSRAEVDGNMAARSIAGSKGLSREGFQGTSVLL